MFLNFIKDLRLKKIIKKTLSNYQAATSNGKIATVGILLDETYFKQREAIINKLVEQGVKRNDITTLSYLDTLKKGEQPGFSFFTYKDVAPAGEIAGRDAAAFINKPFDLLISYYDVEKLPLVLATLKSRAAFKAGFATVDYRLNGLVIAAGSGNTDFVYELIKYLKILDKL